MHFIQEKLQSQKQYSLYQKQHHGPTSANCTTSSTLFLSSFSKFLASFLSSFLCTGLSGLRPSLEQEKSSQRVIRRDLQGSGNLGESQVCYWVEWVRRRSRRPSRQSSNKKKIQGCLFCNLQFHFSPSTQCPICPLIGFY